MDRTAEAQTLLAISDAGSISGAARALGLNKSVVSRRLAALEARLDVGLVNRSTRRLSLTEAGELYRDRARDLLQGWASLEEGLRGEDASLSGPIRIAAPLSFGLSQLAPVLLSFAQSHPDVTLDVDFSDRVTDLIGEGFDLAVRIGRLPDSELRAKRLGQAAMIAVASPDWIAGRGLTQIADFAGEAELRYSLRSLNVMRVHPPTGGDVALGTRDAMRSSSGDFLRDAAIAGAGMTVLPEFIVCDAVRDGTLIRLLSDHRFDALDIHAVYPASRHQPRRVRALINRMAEAFDAAGGEPPWRVVEDDVR